MVEAAISVTELAQNVRNRPGSREKTAERPTGDENQVHKKESHYRRGRPVSSPCLSDTGELLASEIQEPLGGHTRLIAVFDIETHLDNQVNQQPHVVQQHGEPEVE